MQSIQSDNECYISIPLYGREMITAQLFDNLNIKHVLLPNMDFWDTSLFYAMDDPSGSLYRFDNKFDKMAILLASLINIHHVPDQSQSRLINDI